MQTSPLVRFFAQPHQPFFALGIFNALATMVIFLLAWHGVLEAPLLRWHGYGMLFAVFGNFFFGFTFTTFPRFSAQPPIDARRWMRVWLLSLLASVSLEASLLLEAAFYAATIFMALAFALTIRIFLSIYRQAPEPREDQYWIVVALGMGALSNLLYLLAAIPCGGCRDGVFASWAAGVGVWLYLLFLPMVVGVRMVPFFSRVLDYSKSRGFLSLLFGLLLLRVVVANMAPVWLGAVDGALALLLGRELWRMRLPFPHPDPLLWSLHLALFWLPLGFFIGALAELAGSLWGLAFPRLTLHLVALGFVTTIFVAFGTRVTLGHGGRPLQVDRVGVLIFGMTQLLVLSRMALAMGGGALWFDLSAALWIALFLAWILKYGAILLGGNAQ